MRLLSYTVITEFTIFSNSPQQAPAAAPSWARVKRPKKKKNPAPIIWRKPRQQKKAWRNEICYSTENLESTPRKFQKMQDTKEDMNSGSTAFQSKTWKSPDWSRKQEHLTLIVVCRLRDRRKDRCARCIWTSGRSFFLISTVSPVLDSQQSCSNVPWRPQWQEAQGLGFYELCTLHVIIFSFIVISANLE
jgi:hypothetical protein